MASTISLQDDDNGPSLSQHALTRKELIRGVANRFVFSRAYILLYLAMAGLSLATVVLSLLSDCPSLLFYIFEIIVNTALVAEVGIRLLAFGRQFWQSYFNIIDLIVSAFCVITLAVVFGAGCSAKGEEVFDTILLIFRNMLQFGRLALVMRRSGHSVFSRVPAIDLAAARNSSYSLDLDLDDEEARLSDRRLDGGERDDRSATQFALEDEDDEPTPRPR